MSENRRKSSQIRVFARPVGLDFDLKCFVCDRGPLGDRKVMSNMCMICDLGTEDSLHSMFSGSRIDYYHGDEATPQLKIGACEYHIQNLNALFIATKAAGYCTEWIAQACNNLHIHH